MSNFSKDKGYKILVGRPRLKPWEQRITASFRLTYETYQRIQRLAKREKIVPSKALELLVRTAESEEIEPTQVVDYSKINNKGTGYSVTSILDKHFKD
jgi:predicted DNA-binding protein